MKICIEKRLYNKFNYGFTLKFKKINYGVDIFPLQFWWHVFTPGWHADRGLYISIGLGLIAIFRGY